MSSRWLEAYATWVKRGAGWILLGLFSLTVLLVVQLPRLQVVNDLQAFYPDDPRTRVYRQVVEAFGEAPFPHTLYVRFTPRAGGALTSAEAVLEMEAVLEALRAVPGVARAQGLPDLVKFIASGLHGGDPAFARLPVDGDPLGYSFEDVIRLTTQRLSSVQDYLSPQGSALAWAAFDPDADLLQTARAAADALAPLQESAEATRVELMGYGLSILDFNRATVSDLMSYLPLAAALMMFVLLLAFRAPLRAWVVVLALIALVAAWSLQFTADAALGTAAFWAALAFGLAAAGAHLHGEGTPRPTRLRAVAVLALLSLTVALSAGPAWGLVTLGLGVVAVSLKRMSEVYLPMAVVAVSGLWTFGLMSLTGVPLSFLMIAVLPLLLGVGLDDSLHLLHRYRHERHAGRERFEALRTTLGHTGKALWLTTLTTVAGFAALIASSSPPVRAFGLLSTFAMLSAFAVTLTLVPAAQRYLGTPNGRRGNRKPAVVRGLARYLTRPRWAGAWTAVALLVGGLAFAAGLELEVYPYDLRWMLPEGNEQIRLYEEINREFKSYDEVQILLEGEIADLEVMRALNQALVPALAASPYSRGVQHAGRLLDDLRFANPALAQTFMAAFAQSPDRAYSQLMDAVWEQGPLRDRARALLHRGPEGAYDAAVVRINVLRAHEPEGVAAITADLERRLEEARPALEAAGLSVSLTGSPYLESLSLTALREGFFISMGLAFLLVGIVLVWAFRSVSWALVCLVPIALVMALELATIHWLGLRISASTALVAALGIGLGVDYTIHLTQRVRETGSIGRGCSLVSTALVAASGTTLAAFLTLVLGQIPWNRDFGVLASTAIAYALLVGLGVYPAVLTVARRWLRVGGRPLVADDDTQGGHA